MGRGVVVDDDPVVEHPLVRVFAEARAIEEYADDGVAVDAGDLLGEPGDPGADGFRQLLRDSAPQRPEVIVGGAHRAADHGVAKEERPSATLGRTPPTA